jgi:hypothetical protein
MVMCPTGLGSGKDFVDKAKQTRPLVYVHVCSLTCNILVHVFTSDMHFLCGRICLAYMRFVERIFVILLCVVVQPRVQNPRNVPERHKSERS